MKTFNELLEDKKAIEKIVNIYDLELKNFCKKESNSSGLIGDEMRKSKVFITAKNGFDVWFKKLQDINVFINRNYKKENREYHKQQRFLKN